jgi:hypothetical protein
MFQTPGKADSRNEEMIAIGALHSETKGLDASGPTAIVGEDGHDKCAEHASVMEAQEAEKSDDLWKSKSVAEKTIFFLAFVCPWACSTVLSWLPFSTTTIRDAPQEVYVGPVQFAPRSGFD